jgi:ABC-type Fe3+/spermidine/putrescine transport system ATPase subunit
MHAIVVNEPLWKLDQVGLGPARLRDVSLWIQPGITALIGWSGAGKTSLLNLLVGFEVPDRGVISAPALPLAWVPQNGGLWPHCTVREHLLLAAPSSAVDALLAGFDLEEKAAVRPGDLSEGEQSRLSVARALATNAGVLLMDEPLVHVDPARAGNYWRQIREHLARTGAALVFSTHVPETVLGEADRAICLRHGAVLHEGPVDELYSHPATPELMNFLGPGNWLTPEEAWTWLGLPVESARCFRPEQLVIVPVAISKFQVESARFCGSMAQVTVREAGSGQTRQFFHRPTASLLKPGMSLSLELAR